MQIAAISIEEKPVPKDSREIVTDGELKRKLLEGVRHNAQTTQENENKRCSLFCGDSFCGELLRD